MSRQIDVTTGRTVEVLEFGDELMLRVDSEHLMSAESASLSLHFNGDETKVEGVELTLSAYRSEVLKLVKAGRVAFGMAELAQLAPMAPITLRLRGREALCAPFQSALAEGWVLTDCLTAPGRHRFPAFFDLENYQVEDVFQRP